MKKTRRWTQNYIQERENGMIITIKKIKFLVVYPLQITI